MTAEKVTMGLNYGRLVTAGAAASFAAGAAGIAVPAAGSDTIVRKLPAEWDEAVDVLIVGSGFAGLAAAATATGTGIQEVVILEKRGAYGGNSIMSGGGYCAWDSKLHLRQKFSRGDDSVDLHVKDTLVSGGYYSIPELVKVMVEGAPDALNWMIDNGVQMRDYIGRVGGHSAYRDHSPVGSHGRDYTDVLRRVAEKGGATIRTKHKATWIWRDAGHGAVLGLEVETPNGKQNIRARQAVILTSGGFSRDIEMRKAVNPMITADYNSTNQPGATGEMIRYAQAIGADTLQLSFIQLLPYANPKTGKGDNGTLFAVRGPAFGMMVVSKKGKRFVNELEKRDVISMAEVATGEKPTFSIFNEKMLPMLGGELAEKEVERTVSRGRIFKADSVAELSTILGIPPATLEETTRKYVQYMKEGKDPEFGRPFTSAMVPLDEGPFYGIPQWPSVHHCMGGLRINTKAQVLDIWQKPIPHLYAAGEVTGGIHGNNRLGGNATADCVVFGRIAGSNAAKEKPIA